MDATWDVIKNFANTYSISINWVDLGNLYFLKAFEGPFELECYLQKNGGTEQTDFETNYKPNGNQSARSNVVQVLGKDLLSLYPFGAKVNPSAGVTTNCDIQIPFTTVVKGGVLFSTDATVGDYIVCEVIDKDNVLGQGATPDNPIVLGQYVYKWYVMPGHPNILEDISISQPLPQGLYFRFAYTSVGTTAPTVLVNFISYVAIS